MISAWQMSLPVLNKEDNLLAAEINCNLRNVCSTIQKIVCKEYRQNVKFGVVYKAEV